MKRGLMIICVIIVIALLVACSNFTSQDQDYYILGDHPREEQLSQEAPFPLTESTFSTEVQIDEELIPTATALPENRGFYLDGDVCVDTQHVTLHFPVVWADFLYVEIETSGYSQLVHYYSVLPTCELRVFTISFGGEMEHSLGMIGADQEKQCDVGFTVYEISQESMVDSAYRDVVFGMQESVNYVIDRIMAEPAFIS